MTMVGTDKIASLTGYSVKSIIRLVKKGIIPGAYQADEDCEFRFDYDLVKKWWKSKEVSTCQFISAVPSIGLGFSSEDRKSVNQRILEIKQRRKNLRGNSVPSTQGLRVVVSHA